MFSYVCLYSDLLSSDYVEIHVEDGKPTHSKVISKYQNQYCHIHVFHRHIFGGVSVALSSWGFRRKNEIIVEVSRAVNVWLLRGQQFWLNTESLCVNPPWMKVFQYCCRGVSIQEAWVTVNDQRAWVGKKVEVSNSTHDKLNNSKSECEASHPMSLSEHWDKGSFPCSIVCCQHHEPSILSHESCMWTPLSFLCLSSLNDMYEGTSGSKVKRLSSAPCCCCRWHCCYGHTEH